MLIAYTWFEYQSLQMLPGTLMIPYKPALFCSNSFIYNSNGSQSFQKYNMQGRSLEDVYKMC